MTKLKKSELQKDLWIDQYGKVILADTVKELKAQAGAGRVFKIYHDLPNRDVAHIGYGVGKRWFSRYTPVEIKQ